MPAIRYPTMGDHLSRLVRKPRASAAIKPVVSVRMRSTLYMIRLTRVSGAGFVLCGRRPALCSGCPGAESPERRQKGPGDGEDLDRQNHIVFESQLVGRIALSHG